MKKQNDGCSRKDCDRPLYARGKCQKHYCADRLKTPRVKALRRAAERSFSRRYVHLRQTAKDRGLALTITAEEHAVLLSQPCVYCGKTLAPTGHGLDRKDNSMGYVQGNVAPCCGPCNRIKNSHLTYEEMLVAMRAVIRYRSALDKTHV